MKKFIASVMVVCISATFLFAGTSAVPRTPAVPSNDEYAFFDVEGVELTDAEKVEVEGGYDPDAGGNNWSWTRDRVEKVAEYLDQRSEIKVSVSIVPQISSPKVSWGYDITPPRGPYASFSAGPVTVTTKLQDKSKNTPKKTSTRKKGSR